MPAPITREIARQIAEEYLRDHPADSGEECALLAAGAREIKRGWVFEYDSKRFIETGLDIFALLGKSRLLVDRRTGEVVEI